MSFRLTNIDKVSVSLAVWLALDEYDYVDDPRYISATTLLKPMKEIILSRQNCDLETVADVVSLIASRVGNSYHDGIERAWKMEKYRNKALKALGYPDHVIDRIVINPSNSDIAQNPDMIPVYLELRSEREIEDFIVSGKLDFCIEGRLEDFKSTSVFAKIFESNNAKYIEQGSIYRWLRPDVITEDTLTIQYIFTDWVASKAKQDKNYPQKRILSQRLQLMSLPDTEKMIRSRLREIKRLADLPQADLPRCTPEELWQRPTTWKYYKDPNKTTRSTKNFDNPGDATQRWEADGKVGVVKEVHGEVKKCAYCKVVALCDQAQEYVDAGILTL